MDDFRKQILEDIADYRAKYPNIPNIDKDEWAFNFWVLGKLFSVEEELIEEQITDYSDLGTDCYVWHEDLHDLYIIQNKFYNDSSTITNSYIQNDFLTRTIGALEKGTYTKNKELQDIYTKYCNEDNFSIHYHIYVTNNTSKSKSIVDGIASFNEKYASKRIDCHYYSLDDIKSRYFDEPYTNKKFFSYKIQTINKGTILSVNNDAYKMTLAINAKYVLTPVLVVYSMYKSAQNCQYSLFDENIREYLGSTVTVNKKMAQTLNNPEDRCNFFFYNNGITMIVSKIESEKTEGNNRVIKVDNPQIVNGCQTVSTIYEVLSSLPEASIEKDFANTYVMIKVLEIPFESEKLKELYRNIVTYNNSQNSINEKTFTATQNIFKRLQNEFEWRGFLVCIKQSDKNTYLKQYNSIALLLDKNKVLLERFSLKGFKKPQNFMIELEKLLQIFLAFISTPQNTIQNKSKILKDGSIQNQQINEFIKSQDVTSNDCINLFLLYLRACQQKNENNGKVPNPYYLIFCFSRYECNGNPAKISLKLASKDDIDKIIYKYTKILSKYYRDWVSLNENKEYNDMIKSHINCELLDKCKIDVEDILRDI